MALVNCRECNKEVSETAKVCPQCGIKKPYTNKKRQSQRAILYAIIIIFIGYGMEQSGKTPYVPNNIDYIVRAQNNVKATLKDPSSAEFKDLLVYKTTGIPVVCGVVNAKNSFGGYTGWTAFISVGDTATVDNNEDEKLFIRSWKNLCH